VPPLPAALVPPLPALVPPLPALVPPLPAALVPPLPALAPALPPSPASPAEPPAPPPPWWGAQLELNATTKAADQRADTRGVRFSNDIGPPSVGAWCALERVSRAWMYTAVWRDLESRKLRLRTRGVFEKVRQFGQSAARVFRLLAGGANSEFATTHLATPVSLSGAQQRRWK
jgi:hypothetical protein